MPETDLSRFAVVLCRAEEGGNVGSSCRAMKTMGLSSLVLASCPEYDEDRVRTMAVHAGDLYEAAERRPDLASALADFGLSAGFTRRRGERRKGFSLSVEEFARRALSRPAPGRIALVFGNERDGLSDAELSLCSLAVHIPSAAAFPSINLAQAVQIACYELRRQAIEGREGSALPASRSEVDEVVARLERLFKSLGFFKLTEGKKALDFLRDASERAGLCPAELGYLEILFQKTAALAARSRPEGDSGGSSVAGEMPERGIPEGPAANS
jgi:TrmH family RNA methyltransferase